MSDFPDFSELGYQVIRELGHNYVGGRITYLATNTRTQQPVVIKQFHFAKEASDWSGYKAYEREIQVLQGLNHPGIPSYLDSFETPDGFCMVQEYKNAQSLAVPRSFDPDEIKQIAASVLEILVYLQQRIPPIIHRDIKPENILVDEGGHGGTAATVYLVDFGFARIGGGEVGMSSVALGTLGFMPPEQLYNRQLTEATDLYSLGMTLICLLTRTKSTAIETLIDEDGRINFQPLVPKLSLRFINWLEKLVQHNPKNRYANAAAALEALRPIYVIRIPEVQLLQSRLEFQATRLGERLTQTITVSNSIPETLLEGRWEVAPPESDPPHTPDYHPWIKFTPIKFESNHAECRITVDTSHLRAGKIYERQILLHTNSATETYFLKVQVLTAAISIATGKLPYGSLARLGGLCFAVVWLGSQLWLLSPKISLALMFLVLCGALFEATSRGVANKLSKHIKLLFKRIEVFVFGFLAVFFGIFEPFIRICVAYLMIVLFGYLGAYIIFNSYQIRTRIEGKEFSKLASVAILIMTIGLGSSLGFGLKLGDLNLWALAAVLGTGLPLAGMLLYPSWQRSRLIAKYRQSEQHLIQP